MKPKLRDRQTREIKKMAAEMTREELGQYIEWYKERVKSCNQKLKILREEYFSEERSK